MKDLELFNSYVTLLKENGFKLYTSVRENEKPSWAHIVKGENIGYVQCAYFGGLSFSTEHKPNKNCGSGFGLTENGIYNPTVNDAERSFIFAPHWAKKEDVKHVIKYKGWEDYLKNPINQILTYTEL
jgi:hypothetical protein